MTKKEQIIELLDKYGNETDLFKAFITKDEFSDLADEIVKLLCQPAVIQRIELLAFKKFISKTPQTELEYYSDEEFTDLYLKANYC
jgi:hypothetical protein